MNYLKETKYSLLGTTPLISSFVLLFLLFGHCKSFAQLGIADPITVKVAVVMQDPKIPSMGNKRMHELFKTPGYTFQWNDPWELMKAYRDTLNAVSGGAVNYEIVRIYDDSEMFTRLGKDKDLMDLDQVVKYLSEPDWATFKDKGTKFDYNAFIDHYGFCEMRDRGEINEVWLWTFPMGGTWESTFAGEGAFWLNSNPVENTDCNELLTIMGLNYERDMSLALESYGHRSESVMRKVYDRWDNKSAERNNWELFTSFDKVVPGKAHIGNIHFPPNGLADYDWTNKEKVKTYADSWENYPNISETNPRIVDCEEWDCSHLGYMTWWYRHLPNFKGLNPEDGKLNNWWHYIIDYNGAIEKEKSLKGI